MQISTIPDIYLCCCGGGGLIAGTSTYLKEKFTNKNIEISAQKYLKEFYTDLGYEFTGSEYLEDGIPHIRMIKHQSI